MSQAPPLPSIHDFREAPAPPTSTAIELYYPDSDGEPLGETGFHVRVIQGLLVALQLAFRRRSDIYVAADMFLYYEQGNPSAVKAPDVMVIPGTNTYERRSWKVWVEQAVPSVVIEVTSDKTRREDIVYKPDVYARLGVAEYFLFDPLGQYLDPPFRAHRLVGDRYERVEPDAEGRFVSHELGGLSFRQEGPLIRVITADGEPIPTVIELGEAQEEQDREINRLQRRLAAERRRVERNSKRAERAILRAEAERSRAEAERNRANTLAAEIERLRKLLGD